MHEQVRYIDCSIKGLAQRKLVVLASNYSGPLYGYCVWPIVGSSSSKINVWLIINDEDLNRGVEKEMPPTPLTKRQVEYILNHAAGRTTLIFTDTYPANTLKDNVWIVTLDIPEPNQVLSPVPFVNLAHDSNTCTICNFI